MAAQAAGNLRRERHPADFRRSANRALHYWAHLVLPAFQRATRSAGVWKKVQVCGVMAGPRLDEVKDNAFRLPSRLNSTWGGNFTDMVRSTHYLRIIEKENLVENAGKVGTYFLEQLLDWQRECEMVSAVRGRGLFIAFDLPNARTRDDVWRKLFDSGLLVLKSGERSIRFRPALDIAKKVVDEALEILRKYCRGK